jgi:hypothetical protein
MQRSDHDLTPAVSAIAIVTTEFAATFTPLPVVLPFTVQMGDVM